MSTPQSVENWEKEWETFCKKRYGTSISASGMVEGKIFIRKLLIKEREEAYQWGVEDSQDGMDDTNNVAYNSGRQDVLETVIREVEKTIEKGFAETDTYSEVQQEIAWKNDARRDVLSLLTSLKDKTAICE